MINIRAGEGLVLVLEVICRLRWKKDHNQTFNKCVECLTIHPLQIKLIFIIVI